MAAASMLTEKYIISYVIPDHLLSYFLDGEANGESLLEAENPSNGAAAPSLERRSSRSQPSSSNALGRLAQSHSGFSSQNLSHNNYGDPLGTSSSGQLRVHFSDDSLAAHQARQGALLGSNLPAPMQTSQQRRLSASSSVQMASNGSLQKVPSTPSTAKSSDSSLTNLAAALALGAPPSQVMIMQQQLQAREESKANVVSESQLSITPLGMVSPKNQEYMMLPPPPRFPGSIISAQNMFQQQHQNAQQIQQEPQRQQAKQVHPMTQPPSWNQQVNGSSFNGTTQQSMQAQQPITHNRYPQTPHAGFPDPNSVTGSVLTQQSQPSAQQIHIGVNGQTIPVTAVPSTNGSVFYQIDPNIASTANLMYFTKAINEVSKPVEQKEDPAILAEKRQRRLARNRESARQSRRRKKERLVNLGAKVNELQRKLESDVRDKIISMEAGLITERASQFQRWIESGGSDAKLMATLRSTGVNCPIRRSVIAHQYDFLRQAFFSSHNQFSVWLMRQPHSCFTTSNYLKPMPVPDKDGKKSTAGTRANSKLVGEKIFADEKTKNEGKWVNCQATDKLLLWPLYCYEVGMTMEQEDRIVNQAHKDFNAISDFQPKLQQMHTLRSVTNQMQNTTLCLSQLSSQRQDSLLDILTPAQTVALLEWTKKNKDRARIAMERKIKTNGRPHSLVGALQKLEDVRLQMSAKPPTDEAEC